MKNIILRIIFLFGFVTVIASSSFASDDQVRDAFEKKYQIWKS